MAFPDPNSIYSILLTQGGEKPKNGLDTALSIFKNLQTSKLSKSLAISKYQTIDRFGVKQSQEGLSEDEIAKIKAAKASHKSAMNETRTQYEDLAGQAVTKVEKIKAGYQGALRSKTKIVPNSGPLSDDALISLLFDGKNADIMRNILGPGSNIEVFRKDFENSSEYNLERIEKMGLIFMWKSFPETYFHPLLAKRLFAYGKLIDPKVVPERVVVTSLAVASILDRAKPRLLAMLAMATSHFGKLGTGTGTGLYNEDTVEYTLLTFSLFGARRLVMSDKQWFFIWLVLGSALGLSPDRLHANAEVAKARMAELRKSCWPKDGTLAGLSNEQRVLLQAWVTANDWTKTSDKLEEANKVGAISHRMESYLRLFDRWPDRLVRNKLSGDID